MRFDASKVQVLVESKNEKFTFGYKVSGTIVFNSRSVKCDICYSTFARLLPKFYSVYYGAEFPWTEQKNTICNSCPVAENPVEFKSKRIKRCCFQTD
jgi:uncharacterized repeat protein (TIGR04076 family)